MGFLPGPTSLGSNEIMRLLNIGEILWDVIGEEEQLGGALLNFSVHVSRLGHQAFLVSAVGNDERGDRALEAARASGLSTDFVQRSSEFHTGIVRVTLDHDRQPCFVIQRPAAYDSITLDEPARAQLASLNPDWICYGTLLSMYPRGRDAVVKAMEAAPRAGRFYDVNLRKDCYTPELVLELLRRADVVKLNDSEASAVSGMLGTDHVTLEAFCRDCTSRLGWKAVCVTRGERGCVVLAGDQYAENPGYRTQVADAVGAGDAFAAAFLHGLNAGWPVAEIGDFANRLGALVASRPGGAPQWSLEELPALPASR